MNDKFRTNDRVCKKSNTTRSTIGGGTAFPSGAPEFTPVFRGVRVARSLVFCVVFFRLLFVLLFFFYIGYFTGYVQVYMHTSQNVTEEVQIRIEPVNVNDWTAKFPKYKDVPENITQTEWWKAAEFIQWYGFQYLAIVNFFFRKLLSMCVIM